mmetsp:Transcript_81267/g.226251  ORF Transcript_81267/g.226251 Transcript_81267/m.226251 type:complete len:261 (-) Transcript_81267:896-1678(-)
MRSDSSTRSSASSSPTQAASATCSALPISSNPVPPPTLLMAFAGMRSLTLSLTATSGTDWEMPLSMACTRFSKRSVAPIASSARQLMSASAVQRSLRSRDTSWLRFPILASMSSTAPLRLVTAKLVSSSVAATFFMSRCSTCSTSRATLSARVRKWSGRNLSEAPPRPCEGASAPTCFANSRASWPTSRCVSSSAERSDATSSFVLMLAGSTFRVLSRRALNTAVSAEAIAPPRCKPSILRSASSTRRMAAWLRASIMPR